MSAHGTEGTAPPPPEDTHSPASLTPVLGQHTTPPSRRRLILRLALPLLGVLLAVALFHDVLWLFAAPLMLLIAAPVLPGRDRRRGAATEVTQTGIEVAGRGWRKAYRWADVREVYPRASWAYYSTMRTADGSTVVLPGLSDEAAEQLERARVDMSRP